MSSTELPPSQAPKFAALGAFAVMIVGALSWFLLRDDDRPVTPEPEQVALPEPQPPSVRALAPRGEGAGWGWINPRPRAMPTWYGVDVAGPGRIALVGADGFAARFVADLLVTWRTGTTEALRDIAFVDGDDALAVGDAGTLVRLTLSGPRALATGTDVPLRSVTALGNGRAIVTGERGTLLRIDGDDVTALDSGTSLGLTAAHARGDTIWVVGERGTILRIEGDRRANEDAGLGVTLRAIGGCPRGDLYAAGDRATLLRRRTDGSWQNVLTTLDSGETLTSITCDAGRAAIVGTQGSLVLASGTRYVVMPTGFERAFHGVAGAEGEATWLVGAGGRLAAIRDDRVETLTDGPAVPLRDIDAIGGALVAVGEWGRIVRQTEQGLRESESPTDAGLAALAALDESRLVAVGDAGAIVEVRWDGAALVPSPTDASLRDVVAAADGRLLAVGTSGTVVRGTLDSLAATRIADAGDLWALHGTPDDAIAVGDRGTVVRITGAGTTRWSCNERGSLRAVLRHDGRTLAVGEDGLVVSLTPAACTREHHGGPTLEAITLGPDGRPLAVGESGTALARDPDGTWRPVELDLGGNHARHASRLGRHVYVVGTGGTIVRHVIADGT